ARVARGVLLLAPDASRVLQDLRRRMPEAMFELADVMLLDVDQPVRFLQLLDDVGDVLGADLGLEQDLLQTLAAYADPLLDAVAPDLRDLALGGLRDELLALPGEALQATHLLQERVGALVLFRLGALGHLLGRLGLVVAEDVTGFRLALAELL